MNDFWLITLLIAIGIYTVTLINIFIVLDYLRDKEDKTDKAQEEL